MWLAALRLDDWTEESCDVPPRAVAFLQHHPSERLCDLPRRPCFSSICKNEGIHYREYPWLAMSGLALEVLSYLIQEDNGSEQFETFEVRYGQAEDVCREIIAAGERDWIMRVPDAQFPISRPADGAWFMSLLSKASLRFESCFRAQGRSTLFARGRSNAEILQLAWPIIRGQDFTTDKVEDQTLICDWNAFIDGLPKGGTWQEHPIILQMVLWDLWRKRDDPLEFEDYCWHRRRHRWAQVFQSLDVNRICLHAGLGADVMERAFCERAVQALRRTAERFGVAVEHDDVRARVSRSRACES